MSVNHIVVKAPSEAVWEVLADGWLYPLWVVGAARMREVDDSWPAVGSHLHHSVGLWPVLLDDTTEVTAMTEGRELTLRARAWPAGEATVVVTLTPRGEHTLVEMLEDVANGPARLIPKAARTPALSWRNSESLVRLAALVEGRRIQ